MSLAPSKKFHDLVNFPICLAPMVGLSHISLRLLVRQYLPENAKTIWPTEMLNSRRLPQEKVGFTPETLKEEFEDNLVPQILGNEESFITASVEKLEKWGAVGIDINMGCPVKKALKHNYGVALMGDVNYAREVVAMTVRNTNLPISVKLRAGIQKDQKFLDDFLLQMQNAGASWICLHPRIASEQRRGRADWEQITLAKKLLKIPLIGNGDVQTAEDALRMLEVTGCDAAMVGRALTARPWLLWQVGEKLGFANPVGKAGRVPRDPFEEGEEFGRAILFMLEKNFKYFGDDLGYRKFYFYIKICSSWLEFGHALSSLVSRHRQKDILQQEIEQFFKTPQKMYAKTDLRQ